MKRIFYIIFVLCTIEGLISCADDPQLPTINGNWDYLEPYFKFEYATDSIVLEMNQGQKMAFAVTDLQGMYRGIAGQKMKAYFKGMEFISGEQLLVKARTAKGIPINLPVSYLRTSELLQLSLQQEQMQGLMGKSAVNIPPISLKYEVTEDHRMTIYLDEVYLQVIYSMMEDDILPLIIRKVMPTYDRIPSNVQEKIKTEFKTRIRSIFDQIIRLQIGFVLTPKSPD